MYFYIHSYYHIYTGSATIANGMATVTVDGLECEVIYDITAGGTLNEALVGPRSSHGTVTSGPCPLPMPTRSVETPSMSGKDMHTYTYNSDKHITVNYSGCCINTWSHLVAGVKSTMTILNVQYSALVIISSLQNSALMSQILNSM